MRYDSQSTAANLADVAHDLTRCLERLSQRRRLDDAALDDLQLAGSLLESLPLDTSQFALACGRLMNAERYLNADEPGAARFELRLLAAGITYGSGGVREPNRRLRRAEQRSA